MTREEAIEKFRKQLTAAQVILDSGFGTHPGENDRLYRERKEMAEIAIAALTPPTQEQMERVWPGCELCKNARYVSGTAFVCGSVDEQHDFSVIWTDEDEGGFNFDYCPNCGRPLIPAAWEEAAKRLEATNDGENN